MLSSTCSQTEVPRRLLPGCARTRKLRSSAATVEKITLLCKWKINFAAFGRKVCRKRPLFVPKMGVSQLKSEEEVCRDSENGRKTLLCFGSGSGDLHAHRGQGFVPSESRFSML